MSRKRSEAAIRVYEEKFIEGGIARGASRAVAEQVWSQIVGFSGFGFPKAHSAAFGLLAYQSTWLRVHYHPEFLCALLNEQPMGFYPPDSLVHEAQRWGVEVLPPCVVRAAGQRRRAFGGGLAVRLGLGYVGGVKEGEVRALVAEREWAGLGVRLVISPGARGFRETLGKLAWAGACDALVEGPESERRRRRCGRWGWRFRGRRCPRALQLSLPLDPHEGPELRALTAWERMLADYGSTGVTLREHPLELMRPDLPGDLRTSEQLERHPNGRRVRVAGLVVARQRPATAKGVTFMLLEDEHGTINLIVPPPVHDRFRLAVRTEPLVLATGRLERREGTTNVLVDRIERLERPDLPRGDQAHRAPPGLEQRGRRGPSWAPARRWRRAPRPTSVRSPRPATAARRALARRDPAVLTAVRPSRERPRRHCRPPAVAPPAAHRPRRGRAPLQPLDRAARRRRRSTSPAWANAPLMRSP